MDSPPQYQGRKSSSGSMESAKKAKSPKVNANSYCGRHSDEYLFGGHSITDLFRSLKSRKE